MKVIGVTMVKDEADIIRSTVENMLAQVDGVIVGDNMSTDATPEILKELQEKHGRRLKVLYDDEVGYYQSAKMTTLANVAHSDMGAHWIVPFDADEMWYSPFGSIREVLKTVPAKFSIVPATVFDHVATAEDDQNEDPVARMGWRRAAPLGLPKVACRWRGDLRIEQGNHAASYGMPTNTFDPLLVVRHFPYRSTEHLIRKVRNGAQAYASVGDALPETTGLHWRQWGKLLDEVGEEAIRDIFRTWYYRADPRSSLVVDGETLPPLIYDPAWVACRHLG